MELEYHEKLRLLRLNAGLTQRQLGEACGYTGNSAERTVQHWEYGRSYPGIDKLRALSEALKVPVETLLP